MGIRGPVSRSTLADAKKKRDWRISADFAQTLIAEARHLCRAVDAAKDYPEPLRRITYDDDTTEARFVFFTNHEELPALTVTNAYRLRWQIELFFKWITQQLKIKRFYGTSENAVKTQIWSAICT